MVFGVNSLFFVLLPCGEKRKHPSLDILLARPVSGILFLFLPIL